MRVTEGSANGGIGIPVTKLAEAIKKVSGAAGSPIKFLNNCLNFSSWPLHIRRRPRDRSLVREDLRSVRVGDGMSVNQSISLDYQLFKLGTAGLQFCLRHLGMQDKQAIDHFLKLLSHVARSHRFSATVLADESAMEVLNQVDDCPLVIGEHTYRFTD